MPQWAMTRHRSIVALDDGDRNAVPAVFLLLSDESSVAGFV